MGEARPSAAHDPVGAEIEDVQDQVDRYGTLLHGGKLGCSYYNFPECLAFAGYRPVKWLLSDPKCSLLLESGVSVPIEMHVPRRHVGLFETCT